MTFHHEFPAFARFFTSSRDDEDCLIFSRLFLVDSRLTTTIEADFQTVFPVWWFSRVFIFLFTLCFLLSPFDSRVLLTLASFSDTCWREFVYHTHGSDASFHFLLIRRNIASRKSIPTFIIAPSASSSMKKTFVDILSILRFICFAI